jgi:hypothetical protein
MPPTKTTPRRRTRIRDWLSLLAAPVLLFALFSDAGGGAGDGGAGTGDGGAGDGGDGGAGEGDLGEKGKKALDAERTRARDAEKARKAIEAEHAKTKKELEDLKAAGATDQEKALAAARKEAGDAATAEAVGKANARILSSEIKAAAGTKLADPNDAVRLLDLTEFEVDADGNVDDKKIAAAIDQLLKDKPYLAATAGKKGAGSADGGARDGSAASKTVTPGIGRLRSAYEASSKK